MHLIRKQIIIVESRNITIFTVQKAFEKVIFIFHRVEK